MSLHVALVTPWDKRGGIADYSERFVSALRSEGATVTSVPLEHESATNPWTFVDVLDDIPEDADVVHTQFEAGVFGRAIISGTAAPFYFRRLGARSTPTVTTLHEVHATHPHLPLPGELLLRARDTVIERVALRASDRVVVHTGHAERILDRRHPNTEGVVRMLHPVETDAHPIDAAEARTELGYDRPLIVTFGWVEEKKQYVDVFDALESIPEADYLIAGEPRTAGDESYLDEVLNLARRRGIDDRVHHFGYVPEDQVPVVFSAADAVVLPYDRVSQSGAVNVALGYRRPVVATSLPAFEELASEFGCLLTYEDSAELTELLQTALDDQETRKRLREAATEYTETVTWERFARQSIATYEEL